MTYYGISLGLGGLPGACHAPHARLPTDLGAVLCDLLYAAISAIATNNISTNTANTTTPDATAAGSIYVTFMLTSAAEIPANLLAAWMIERYGRWG